MKLWWRQGLSFSLVYGCNQKMAWFDDMNIFQNCLDCMIWVCPCPTSETMLGSFWVKVCYFFGRRWPFVGHRKAGFKRVSTRRPPLKVWCLSSSLIHTSKLLSGWIGAEWQGCAVEIFRTLLGCWDLVVISGVWARHVLDLSRFNFLLQSLQDWPDMGQVMHTAFLRRPMTLCLMFLGIFWCSSIWSSIPKMWC